MTTLDGRIGVRLWLDIDTLQEREIWSAFCDALQLASGGKSEGEAMRNLLTAVHTYAEVLRRRGVLEKVLDEKGIQYEEIQYDGIRPGQVPLDVLDPYAMANLSGCDNPHTLA